MSAFRSFTGMGIIALAIIAAPALAQQRASPPRPGGGQLPSGSYQQTCRGISMAGNILRAQCPNRRGAPVTSSLEVNSCRGQDIYNDDGRLRCGRGGPGPGPGPRPPLPPIGGGADAIAYTSEGFRGRELVIRGPISNLASYSGFNDNIRSIRIRRGRLQVCEDKSFGGRCAFLTQSVTNLNSIGMSHRISSIR